MGGLAGTRSAEQSRFPQGPVPRSPRDWAVRPEPPASGAEMVFYDSSI